MNWDSRTLFHQSPSRYKCSFVDVPRWSCHFRGHIRSEARPLRGIATSPENDRVHVSAERLSRLIVLTSPDLIA